MLEEHRLDVETSTSLNVDPKPGQSPIMSAHRREYPTQPPSRTSDSTHREATPPHLPPIHNGHRMQQPESWAEGMHRQADYTARVVEAQGRDIERLNVIAERLQTGMENLYSHMESIATELRARPPPTSDRPAAGMPDLDILATQLQHVTDKTNEIDGLKMQVDIMKRRVRRLEGHGSPPPPGPPAPAEPSAYQQPTSHPHGAPMHSMHAGTPSSEPRPPAYQPPMDTRLPPPASLQSSDSRPLSEYSASNESRTLPGFRQMEAASGLSSWRSASTYSPGQQPGVSEPHHPHLPEPQQATGWAAVNTNHNVKRGSDIDSTDLGQPGSPKRQKLATLMPRTSYGDQSVSSVPSSYHPGGTPESASVPSLQPTRTSSSETQPYPYQPSSNSSVPNNLRFVPFPNTQEAESQDSWRPESQRQPLDAGRGRGRGGRGGRGRSRKSVASNPDHDIEGPEWERPSWTGSQAGADGYYHPGQAQSPPNRVPDSQPPSSTMYSEPQHGAPPETPTPANDPSKKSRTKPIRNADGVLIRKDGRPDMRSVSSAMNLRKVHAKKEAERAGEGPDGTPTLNGADGDERTSTDSPSTPNNGSTSAPPVDTSKDGDSLPTTQERHKENMRKIFPYGIDAPAGFSSVPKPPVSEQRYYSPAGRDEARGLEASTEHPPSYETHTEKGSQIDSRRESNSNNIQGDSQMTDVVMREMADAQMGNGGGGAVADGGESRVESAVQRAV